MLVFAQQNLVEDPPFTKVDLLSCRNLLIYFDAKLQQRMMPMFHYALRPGGLLFLGSSEAVGTFGHLFEPVDKKWKIFRRKEGPSTTYISDLPAGAGDMASRELSAPRWRAARPTRHRAKRGAGADAAPGPARDADARARRDRAHPRPHRSVPGTGAWSADQRERVQHGPRRACNWTWRSRCATRPPARAGVDPSRGSGQNQRARGHGRSPREEADPARGPARSVPGRVRTRRTGFGDRLDRPAGRAGRGHARSRSPSWNASSSTPRRFIRARSRSWRPPTRSSSRPTRSCSRPMKSCRAPTRSSKPRRRRCSRSTRSCRR